MSRRKGLEDLLSSRDRAGYLPTAAELQWTLLVIQSEWTRSERARRARGVVDDNGTARKTRAAERERARFTVPTGRYRAA